MPKVNRTKFQQDAVRGNRAKFSGWRKEGETVGWVHPKIGLWERWCHGALPSIEETDKGKTEFRRRRSNCIGSSKEDIPNPSCPTCQLQEFAIAKLNEGADGSEVILEGGSGKDRLVLDLNDLAGKGDFRTNPKVKSDVIFAWIRQPEEDDDDPKNLIEIVTGPHTLGERILDIVDEQVKARGDVAGDCEVPDGFELKMRKGKLLLTDGENDIDWKPYPLKLKYKADAQPATMYSALKVDNDLCPITPLVAQTMISDDEDLDVDLEKICNPTERSKQLEIIRSSWESRTIPYEEFEEYFNERSGSKKTSKSNRKREEEDEPKKKSKKEESSGDVIACPDCGADNEVGTKFCSFCGTKLKSEKKETDLRCPECGEKITATTKFCGGCGTKIASKKNDEDDEEEEKPKKRSKRDDEDDEEEEKPKKKDGRIGNRIKCPDCGEMVEPMKASGRCPECGEKLGKPSDNDVNY